jgi:hypothetical protein
MSASVDPPDDFRDFVRRRAPRLARACAEIMGNDDVAEELRAELLAVVAGRWRRRPASSREHDTLVHLERLLRRAAREHRAVVPAGALDLTSPVGWTTYLDGRTGPTATSAWREAGQSRRARYRALVLLAVCVAVGALFMPRRPFPDARAEIPYGVTVVPSRDALLLLPPPAMATLPRTLDLSASTVDSLPRLDESPLPAALAVLHADRARLVVVGADAELRRVERPMFAGFGLLATSLSPAGRWIALFHDGALHLLDVTTGLNRDVPGNGDRLVRPVLAWLDQDTVIVPGPDGSQIVDAATGEVTNVDIPVADVLTVRGLREPPLTELIDTPDGDDRTGETDSGSLIRRRPIPGPPTTTAPTTAEPVTGPPWLGSWVGPGWASRLTYVRACEPSRLPLPASVGVPQSAVAALSADGRYQGTLVSLGTDRLDPLGFDTADPRHPLVAVRASSATTVLAWAPEQGRLFQVMAVNADTQISVPDILLREWLSTVEREPAQENAARPVSS